jgi:hypothetical protein
MPIETQRADASRLFNDLLRLDDHWRGQGMSVVQVLDQIGRQAHGLDGLPPEPPEPEPQPEPERLPENWRGDAEQNATE